MHVLWNSGKALDLRSIGRGFNSHLDKAAQQPWASCSHLRAPVTKQYNLLPVEELWRGSAGNVNSSLAESNAWQPTAGDDLHLRADCLYTGISSGLNAR